MKDRELVACIVQNIVLCSTCEFQVGYCVFARYNT